MITSSFSYLNNTSTTDTGVLVLGGVEVYFEKVPKLGGSGELEFTPSSSPFASVRSVGGAGFVALAHVYFKQDAGVPHRPALGLSRIHAGQQGQHGQRLDVGPSLPSLCLFGARSEAQTTWHPSCSLVAEALRSGMDIFHCDHCGHLVFFENTQCTRCGHRLAYLPNVGKMGSLEPLADGLWHSPAADSARTPYPNIAEADDAERERRRIALNELYRTLLGHFRHETGHY